MKTLIACAFLLCLTPAFAQETPKEDPDCIPTPAALAFMKQNEMTPLLLGKSLVHAKTPVQVWMGPNGNFILTRQNEDASKVCLVEAAGEVQINTTLLTKILDLAVGPKA